MIDAMDDGQFHLDPSTYIDMVRAEVPVYDELQDAVADATAGLAVRTVLDLGAGTGETASRVMEHHPGAGLVAIDESEAMVAVASHRLAGADVRVGRLQEPLPDGPFDLVVSALAVHHLPPEQKADLFVRVANVLRVPGRFVLADVIVPADIADQVIPLEPGVDLPDAIDDQLRWLEDAGLAPSLVWQRKDLVVIAADRLA